MIHKNRGNRRWRDNQKAERKQTISKRIHHDGWYAHFGQYRKGKIHCSCPLCSAKTNTKINRSCGPVYEGDRCVSRIPGTNHRYGKKNYKFSELRKLDGMFDQVSEYAAG